MNLKFTFRKMLTAALLSSMAISAGATSYLTENFDYPAGNLYGQGGWVKYGTQTENPIKLVEGGINYPIYQDIATGCRVSISNPQNFNEEDLHVKFADQGICSGAIYMSALIRVKSVNEANFILAFDGRSTSSEIADGKSTSNYWRLFVKKGDEDGTFRFGISKNKSTPTVVCTTDYELNNTYFVVLKYEFVDGVTNDIFSLYIDRLSTIEPESADISVNSGTDATTIDNGSKKDLGIGGVAIMQNGSSSKPGPEFELDALHVASAWDELFTAATLSGGAGDNDSSKEVKITAPSSVDFGYTVSGYALTKTFNVKGSNLTDDITISAPTNNVFSLSCTSIDKDAAMSENGYDVTVTFNSTAAGEYNDQITLSSEGAEPQTIALTGGVDACSDIPTAAALNNQEADTYDLIRYTGNAVVTYIDTTKSRIYAQDMTAGLALDYTYLTDMNIKVGDKITNIIGMRQDAFGGAPEFMLAGLPVQVLSSDNTKTPTETTLADIISDPLSYIYRLVKVSDVTINTDNTTFTGSSIDISSDGKTGKLFPFADSNLIGKDIPAGTITLTGICRSAAIASIGPRSMDDLELGEPSFTATETYKYEGDPIALNTPTVVRRYKVVTENLSEDVQIYLTGSSKGMYSVSPEMIDAGSSTVDVEVTYNPTAIGKHQGRINIDVIPVEFSTGETFTYYAYDPDNMPTISVSPEEVPEFTAKPGETSESQIVVTTANFVDYGSAKVMGEGHGTFRINNTSLMKSGKTAITITFVPTTAGEYTERIELSSLMAETVYVTLKGVCVGDVAEQETEGDELNLSNADPLPFLYEDFSNIGDNNKPLSLERWCNVASEGKRAWWNYGFEDNGNKAAKVTGYDSKVAAGESTACQMLLVTPPLDFVNADTKLFTFRVMGQNLREEQTDLLEVLYMDVVNNEVYSEAIKEIDIPASSDYNNQWTDYVVDFSDQDIADVFYVGFRFTSSRGVDNSAIYYIDDVSWGRSNVAQIKPDETTVEFDATVNESYQTTINVVGNNLVEPIAATLGGESRDMFTLLTNTLPAEGGELSFSFQSEVVGTHSAYIELDSDGAPTAYILLTANNQNNSGVSVITADANGDYTIINMQGIVLLKTSNAADINLLAPGMYIINGKKYVVK